MIFPSFKEEVFKVPYFGIHVLRKPTKPLHVTAMFLTDQIHSDLFCQIILVLEDF